MNRLEKTLVEAGISLIIGCVISAIVHGSVDMSYAMSFMYFLTGWRFIGRYVGHTFIVGDLVKMLFWFVIKAFLCIVIGQWLFYISLILGIGEQVLKIAAFLFSWSYEKSKILR